MPFSDNKNLKNTLKKKQSAKSTFINFFDFASLYPNSIKDYRDWSLNNTKKLYTDSFVIDKLNLEE